MFFHPLDPEVLWHISIATHLTHSQATDLCFLAKVTHKLETLCLALSLSSLSHLRYPPLAQMLDTHDKERKLLKRFTWKHGGYLDVKPPFHTMEQHNTKEGTSHRSAGKQIWVNQPQMYPIRGNKAPFWQKLSKMWELFQMVCSHETLPWISQGNSC